MRIFVLFMGCFSILMGLSQPQWGVEYEATYGIRIQNSKIPNTDFKAPRTHAIGVDHQQNFGEKNTHGYRIGVRYLSTAIEREIKRFDLTVSPTSSFIPFVILTERTSLHYLSIPLQYIHKNKISHMGLGICLHYYLHGRSQIENEDPLPVFLSGRNSFAYGPRGSIGFDLRAWDQFLISPEVTVQLLFPGSGMLFLQSGLSLSIQKIIPMP